MLLDGCRAWLGKSLQCGFIKHRTTESSQHCRERQETLTGEGPGAEMGGYKVKHTALVKNSSNSSLSKPFLPFVSL